MFNQFGDLERCALRAGNVHSADGWDDVLKARRGALPGQGLRHLFFAAFAMPEVYEFLEAERIKYAIRLPANQVLQSRIGYLLTRPVGRQILPPKCLQHPRPQISIPLSRHHWILRRMPSRKSTNGLYPSSCLARSMVQAIVKFISDRT